jgi:hypothetical protein
MLAPDDVVFVQFPLQNGITANWYFTPGAITKVS